MTIQPHEMIIDNFAGAGGASLGIEMALGRSPDVAINHNPEAVAIHAANHPNTQHYCQNIWQAIPHEVTKGRPVGLAWFSPDCKHFSKAKGGKPLEKRIRDLAWTVVLWAKDVRPRVICLENVEEFKTWGPLTEDGKPCPERAGMDFNRWLRELRRLGYKVEWRELKACDYGAPTIRKRLFLVARCDGRPITWPAATHGDPACDDVLSGRLKPWRTAASVIDWTIPAPSIFMTQEEAHALYRQTKIRCKRPLAEKTMDRIAAGTKRYILDRADPFIVPISDWSSFNAGRPVVEPLSTITAFPKGGKHALVTAWLVKHFGGVVGKEITTPFPTITMRGTQNQIVTSHLVHLKGSCKDGKPVTDPVPTVLAGGLHIGEVRAFCMKYYGSGGQWADCRDPMHTITAKDRMSVVTVGGEQYRITDIGMRMLSPRELYRAQGFGDDYIIDPMFQGKPLGKTQQVAGCGNSVSPPAAAALVSAQFSQSSLILEAAE